MEEQNVKMELTSKYKILKQQYEENSKEMSKELKEEYYTTMIAILNLYDRKESCDLKLSKGNI